MTVQQLRRTTMSLRVPEKKGDDGDTSPRKEKKEKKDKKKKKTPRSARGEKPQSLLDLPIEEATGPVNKITTTLKACPVRGVTVYNDRAEVTRTITTNVNAGRKYLFE